MPQTLSAPAPTALITGAAMEALRQDPRRAILEDGIVCLVCGRILRHLTNTHLANHGMTSEMYKHAFGYNGRRSLMAHAVRRMHAANAIRQGLAQMIRQRPIVVDPALRARGGARRRAREEWLNRSESSRQYAVLPSRGTDGRFMAAGVLVPGLS